MSLSIYEFLKQDILAMANYTDKNLKGNIHPLIMQEVERSIILIILENTNYNLLRTAHILGISRTTLYKKIKDHKIEVK